MSSVYFIGGFGVMGWVPAAEYTHARPDPLAETAQEIIRHMNADHADALLLALLNPPPRRNHQSASRGGSVPLAGRRLPTRSEKDGLKPRRRMSQRHRNEPSPNGDSVRLAGPPSSPPPRSGGRWSGQRPPRRQNRGAAQPGVGPREFTPRSTRHISGPAQRQLQTGVLT